MHRVTVALPNDLYRALGITAEKMDRTIPQQLRRAIRVYYEKFPLDLKAVRAEVSNANPE